MTAQLAILLFALALVVGLPVLVIWFLYGWSARGAA